MNPPDNQAAKLRLTSFKVRRGYVIALLFVATLSAGAGLERYFLNSGVPPDSAAEFRLISEAWRIIDRFYVDRPAVRHAQMAAGAIAGMTEALGDTGHSVYLTANEARKAGAAVRGRLNGIGIEITQSTNRQTVIVAPMDGSPAQQAGVRPGDVILEVDGRSVSNMSISHISARMAGEMGKPVALTVMNPSDSKRREITIKRASIKVNNVSWQRLPGTDIAHLRIVMFSEGLTSDLRKALVEIQRQGMKGLVLDLRNNPGGALDEAIGTASQFLSSGNVMWEKNASGMISPIAVLGGGVATNIPMTVLINANSASDSEIVAGALRDSHRAELVGETTLGTGTVLTQFQLPDGSAMMLAVQEWLTPNKQTFWHRGIEPDEKVPMPPDAILRPGAEKEMTAEQLRKCPDVQLLKAIAILSNSLAKN